MKRFSPKKIKVGSRPSPLALRQVQEVKSFFPELDFEVVAIETAGDKNKAASLFYQQDTDFFTAEIEEALLEDKIDIAVHSAKDLEGNIPSGLVIAALTKSLSPFESLVSRGDLTLDKLPEGTRVATSSLKRKQAILTYNPHFIVESIRGNIGERLEQLDNGRFDALIVAHAALIRLGLEDRVAQIIPPEIIPAHPLQGRLAVQVKRERKDLIKIFRRIDDRQIR